MSTPSIQWISFIVVAVLITVAFFWLILPFYGALLWAVILAILFNPLQRRLVRLLNGRENLASVLSVLACICIVVLPGSVILTSLAQEAASLYGRISAREFQPAVILAQIREFLPDFIVQGLSALNLGTLEEMQSGLTTMLGQVSQMVAARAFLIGQGTAQLLVSLGIMLYVLFFLFRDGPRLASTIRKASPLSDHHTDHILAKFAAVVRATVKGNVIIAAIQGILGGLAFWLIGIEAALLWGVLMGVLSLLPAVGAFLVWGPTAVYLLLTGQYLKGAILLVIGLFVISLIDNLLRPPLVGKGTRMPDYLVLVSTLGGITLIGINGFVVGPLIAALFLAVWSLLTDDVAHQQPADDGAT
jgi:predicted PurR-regulated permease PerM